MDLSMPVVDGIEATRQILAGQPDVRIVALTSFVDHPKVAEMLEAGAVGYLLKDCEPADLLSAIRSAGAGGVPLDPRVAGALLPKRQPTSLADQLSDREREVLLLASRGHGQQADRPRSRDRRAHRQGPPWQRLPAHRRQDARRQRSGRARTFLRSRARARAAAEHTPRGLGGDTPRSAARTASWKS